MFIRPEARGDAGQPRWDTFAHSLGFASSGQMALSESERLQLREQIRAAVRDLYPDIYQSSEAGGALAPELLAPVPPSPAQ